MSTNRVSDDIVMLIRSEMDAHLAVTRFGQACAAIGFDQSTVCAIQITTAELGTNIIKYAAHGRIHLRQVAEPQAGIELEARDVGPGIPDIEEALGEYFSTSGTLGMGLPGVKRLMDEFSISSAENVGTVVTVIKWLPA